MDLMLASIKKSAGANFKPTANKDKSKIGIERMVRLLARVYSYSAECADVREFESKDAYADYVMSLDEFTNKFKRGTAVPDGDAVAMREALRWSYHYRNTGEKMKVRLALIEPKELKGTSGDMAAKPTSSIWNSMLLSDYSDYKYPIRRTVKTAGVNSGSETRTRTVNIVQKSLDTYEVELGGGE